MQSDIPTQAVVAAAGDGMTDRLTLLLERSHARSGGINSAKFMLSGSIDGGYRLMEGGGGRMK